MKNQYMDKLIKVKVKADEKENSVEKLKEDEFLVKTKAPRKEGRANESVICILSDYFNIDPSGIRIIKGHTSSSKIFRINDKK
ncbi:MAG: DUF167 domain-containing protein [Elusimicrobiota bacterium]